MTQRLRIRTAPWVAAVIVVLLWYLVIVVGLVQFQLNWTTGALGVVPLSLLLLGIGFARAGPYAPVLLSVALPVGAIAFLLKRRELAR